MADLIRSSSFTPPSGPTPSRIRVMMEMPNGNALRRTVFPAGNIEYITADKNEQESVIRFLGGAEVIVYMSLDELEERSRPNPGVRKNNIIG